MHVLCSCSWVHNSPSCVCTLYLSVQQLRGIWMVFACGCQESYCCKRSRTRFCVSMCFHWSWVHVLRSEITGSCATSSLRESARWFCTVAAPFSIPTSSVCFPASPHFCQHLLLSTLLILAVPVGGHRAVPRCGVDSPSLVTGGVEHLSCAVCLPSPQKHVFGYFACFLVGLFDFLIIDF